MSNDYYNRSNNYTRATTARGDTLEASLDAIEAGFDLLPSTSAMEAGLTNYVVLGGSADAYTATVTGVTSYTAGLEINGKVNATNTTASTLNVNSLGVIAIKRPDVSAVEAGDLTINGIVTLIYNGTVFIITSSTPTVATAAAASATAASNSAAAAAASAAAASTSAGNASNSETNAAASASAASTSETNAATSETNAATSESNASTSETNAGTQATNAATSASNASTSETNAATSASNASTSETNASNSASAASTSASNASTSETNAAASETAAAASAAALSGVATIDTDTEIAADHIEINKNGTGSRKSYIDFHGDTTNTDYALRIIREDTGVNAVSRIHHKGTGVLDLRADDASGKITLSQQTTIALTVDANGDIDGVNLKNYGERSQGLGSIFGAQTIDLASGNVVTATITGATTFSFTTAFTNTSFTLVLTNASTNVTWPTSVKWNGGVQPTWSPTGDDVIVFTKVNTVWYGAAALIGAAS